MFISTWVCMLTATIVPNRGIQAEPRIEMKTIFTFDNKFERSQWLAVNDGVMGGVSQGRAEITRDGVLRFSGKVSLENNGGFSSIRSVPVERDLSAYDGLVIRVHGDGNRYALTLRTDVRIRAGSYRVKFDTRADEWLEIFLPFAEFRAASFGVQRPGSSVHGATGLKPQGNCQPYHPGVENRRRIP